jgi:hypothetical protein
MIETGWTNLTPPRQVPIPHAQDSVSTSGPVRVYVAGGMRQPRVVSAATARPIPRLPFNPRPRMA